VAASLKTGMTTERHGSMSALDLISVIRRFCGSWQRFRQCSIRKYETPVAEGAEKGWGEVRVDQASFGKPDD
jgi:hypothetical protein